MTRVIRFSKLRSYICYTYVALRNGMLINLEISKIKAKQAWNLSPVEHQHQGAKPRFGHPGHLQSLTSTDERE